MMKKVISIICWFMLLVLAGCRDASPYVEEPSAEERTITLNLDITTRADNLLPDNSEPDIIRLWIFDEDNNFITYIVSSQNEWYPVGTDGKDIMTTLQTEIDAKDINSESEFKIYLILNQPYEAYEDSTTPIDFSNIKTISELKLKTFVLTEYDGDNKVPMTGMGTATCTAIEGNKIKFNTSIDATRCVAKLELFVTKNTPGSNLQITGITLSNNPETGILFRNNEFSPIINGNPATNLIGNNSIPITASLSEADAPSSDNLHLFEGNESKLQKITLTNPYLLENLWGDEDIHLEDGSMSITDYRYYITLNYILDGSLIEKKIYLTKIERNTLNMVFIRVKTPVASDICYEVQPWISYTIELPEFN